MFKLKDFNWKDLHGKNLYIHVEVHEEQDKKITYLFGKNLESGILYLLDSKIETNYKNENYCWHCFGDGKVWEYGIEEQWEVNCLYCNGTGKA